MKSKTQGKATKAPAKPFRLEVGKTYETRDGKHRAKIISHSERYLWPYFGKWEKGLRHIQAEFRENGTIFTLDPHRHDLVREVASTKRSRK